MGELVYACLVPHPPIMVPEVGGRETGPVAATVRAMEILARRLAAARPDTLVVITPHGAVFQDVLAITAEASLVGDLGDFRAPAVKFAYANDLELNKLIRRHAQNAGINLACLDADLARQYRTTTRLDHGIMVPLYFLRRELPEVRLVPLAIGFLPYLQLYRFGCGLGAAIRESSGRVAVVASGDLSHRLVPGAPAGFDPRGREFDDLVRERLADFDVPGIFSIPAALIEGAGECGFRPLCLLLGVLDGYEVRAEVLSYEGPFGVGYLVAALEPKARTGARELLAILIRQEDEQAAARREQESPPVRLARATIASYLYDREPPELPAGWPAELEGRAGVFVSLHLDNQLRGCIGTIVPTADCIAAEIRRNAISAAFDDPRFEPLTAAELDRLAISVDVLQPAEPVKDISELNPKLYGVIVSRGSRRGLLLPDLQGVDTAAEQVKIARQKAGIAPGEPCQLERFQVQRYH